MINMLTLVGALASSLMAIIALVAYFMKPIRNKIISSLSKSLKIDDLNDKMDKHISEDSERKKSIELRDSIMDEIKDKLDMHISHSELNESLSREADLCLIRESINKIYYTYKPIGKIPMYVRENLIKLFNLYESMGGNSYISSVVEELLKLPSNV